MRHLVCIAFAASLVFGAQAVAAQITAGAGQSQNDGTADQKILDLLASFPVPNMPTGPFSSWSAEQRELVLTQLRQRCLIMWTMAHDAPGTHVLPQSASKTDEVELGSEICIAGHMPGDWPGRASTISAAKSILARANALGSPLRLPPSLER